MELNDYCMNYMQLSVLVKYLSHSFSCSGCDALWLMIQDFDKDVIKCLFCSEWQEGWYATLTVDV